ncbi:hypothetical protein THARTR1_09300 [Trichoderma harzianum]|uniref:Uncharacterized protein n=1 Tax=Trichoderma harzianum TaxID=5544 RepID=A0A2K0TWR7_TRIHA|nr:hypothetical protein THARTR1_09300 [Trichoderma harzianum]
MPNLFCCSSIRPYRPKRLDHERKFDNFMQWAKSASAEPDDDSSFLSVRYFATVNDGVEFAEVGESDLIAANFEKLNSYKNFKCTAHDKFFEVNLYQENPINRHHWRANIARPATDIDLVYRQKKEKEKEKSTQAIKVEDTKQGDRDDEPEHDDSSGSGVPGSPSQVNKAASQLNIPALKSVLRYLLPKVKTNLGSNPLLSLLALDWANNELSLGLEIEDLWISELKKDNIVAFLRSFVKLSAPDSTTYKVVVEIKDAVGLAIHRAGLLTKEKIHGRSKFQEIINHILALCSASDWVSKCREGILRMFTEAPDERLLELGQRKEDAYQNTYIKMTSRADREVDDNDDYNQYDYSDDYDYNPYEASSPDSDKDLTACDKECGYCGKCSY